MKSVFVLTEESIYGKATTGAFLTYASVIEYFEKKPNAKITKNYIHGFDKYGDCGYMVVSEKRHLTDGTTSKRKYLITQVELYE